MDNRPKNIAAILATGAPACPLEIKSAAYPTPGPHELVIRNRAVAVNPVDPYKQLLGEALLTYVKYPCVQGSDLAGDVVEVGSAISHFAVGDRITAYAAGTLAFGNRPSEGAFQLYTVIREHMAIRIPASVSYERACVVPLAFGAAAYGLFHHEFLKLDTPTASDRVLRNQAVIITSGASSVSANAIQLAVAAGYDVYSTASPKNFDLVRRLGATKVFDYHDENCAAKIISAIKDTKVVGALAVNPGGVALCAKVLNNTDSVKYIADAGPPPPEGYPKGIKSRFIDLLDLDKADCIVWTIFSDFVADALATGRFVAEPEPKVVGMGLEAIEEAYKIRLNGVSAQKLVIILE